MFSFKGFKASFDFITGKQHGFNSEYSSVSTIGTYKSNRDQYNDNKITFTPPRSIDPSMVQLPSSQTRFKPSKSTGNVARATNSTQNVSRSAHDISHNSNTSQLQQQQKIEKQRLLEQKKQEKIADQERKIQEKFAAQERKRQEKLSKERAKQNRNTSNKKVTAKILQPNKRNAPKPPPYNQDSLRQPPIQNASNKNNEKQNKPSNEEKITQTQKITYSTNTLESSTSRSSGPPPYGEFPEIIVEPSNNITFGKPVSESSWDLISQHRQQINKNTTAPPVPKKKKDLQYNVGNLRIDANSDA